MGTATHVEVTARGVWLLALALIALGAWTGWDVAGWDTPGCLPSAGFTAAEDLSCDRVRNLGPSDRRGTLDLVEDSDPEFEALDDSSAFLGGDTSLADECPGSRSLRRLDVLTLAPKQGPPCRLLRRPRSF